MSMYTATTAQSVRRQLSGPTTLDYLYDRELCKEPCDLIEFECGLWISINAPIDDVCLPRPVYLFAEDDDVHQGQNPVHAEGATTRGVL